jgi:hypothetical protein
MLGSPPLSTPTRRRRYDRADDRSQQLLESHIQKGGQILDSPGGAPVSVERIFSIPGAPQH